MRWYRCGRCGRKYGNYRNTGGMTQVYVVDHLKKHLTRSQLIYSNRKGSVAVEFALIATAWLFMMIGVCDFGLAINDKTQVTNAAWAGAEYISINSWNTSTEPAAAQTAAQTAISYPVTANASTQAGCPNANATAVRTPSSGTTCGTYSSPEGNYATVTVTTTYKPLFSVLWGDKTSVSLSATAVTRY
jgi:Flp pilus assembly protein TadG